MRVRIRNIVLLVLAVIFGSMEPAQVQAQPFVIVYTFSTTNYNSFLKTLTNSDGAGPACGLILSGGTLFGTTQYGGTHGDGSVFAVATNGANFQPLHSFTGADGSTPVAGLLQWGGTLFGTTAYGTGSAQYGSLFGLNTDGSSFTTLHLFDGLNDGANPYSSLIISGGSLFGTAAVGGIALGALGSGTVFMLNTNEIYDPANFTVHTFIGGAGGEDPLAGLASSGGQLYGTAAFGGTSGFGAIYTLATNGSGYLPIYNFTNGADGNVPASSLIISGQTLYGMAYSGGSGGAGTVYSLNTDGTGFKVLHSFNGTDGANPATGSGLILSGTVLYGTTQFNGPGGYGTVFGVNTDGSGFRNLYGFTNGADGAKPQGPLLLQGNILYGTAPTGGTNGTGTVFAVTIPPPSLQIAQAPGAITVSWTSSSLYPGLVLQQNTNLNNTNWTTSGYAITTTNGTNTVTFSPPTGMNRAFFRLLSP